KMADFSPENVAMQVQPLADLVEVRTKLKALLSKTEGNDRLEELLEAIMDNAEMRGKLKDVLGAEAPGGSQEG
ncbi:MAG: type VI secretion system contractile sheath small subunit, partial [Candidatus Krumholzibacteriia bacterium]